MTPSPSRVSSRASAGGYPPSSRTGTGRSHGGRSPIASRAPWTRSRRTRRARARTPDDSPCWSSPTPSITPRCPNHTCTRTTNARGSNRGTRLRSWWRPRRAATQTPPPRSPPSSPRVTSPPQPPRYSRAYGAWTTGHGGTRCSTSPRGGGGRVPTKRTRGGATRPATPLVVRCGSRWTRWSNRRNAGSSGDRWRVRCPPCCGRCGRAREATGLWTECSRCSRRLASWRRCGRKRPTRRRSPRDCCRRSSHSCGGGAGRRRCPTRRPPVSKSGVRTRTKRTKKASRSCRRRRRRRSRRWTRRPRN